VADYGAIRTRFVRERLCETHWEEREYIQHLMGIERIIAQGGPKNGESRLLYQRLVRRYPVEHGAIFTELCRGRFTTEEQFRLLCEAQQILWKRQEEADRDSEERTEQNKEDRLNKERMGWFLQGGLE